MILADLFVQPKFPSTIPTTPAQTVALDKQADAARNSAGHFEQDAFAYSGKPSLNLFQSPSGPSPVVTTVLSADIREDDSHIAHEAITTAFSNMGSAVSQMAGLATPLAVGAAMWRSGSTTVPAPPAETEG